MLLAAHGIALFIRSDLPGDGQQIPSQGNRRPALFQRRRARCFAVNMLGTPGGFGCGSGTGSRVVGSAFG
jgi:hypothetical protein